MTLMNFRPCSFPFENVRKNDVFRRNWKENIGIEWVNLRKIKFGCTVAFLNLGSKKTMFVFYSELLSKLTKVLFTGSFGRRSYFFFPDTFRPSVFSR